MAKNEKRVQVTLACEVCKRRNYITTKNKLNDRERIEMKKFCRWDRQHTVHKETRGAMRGRPVLLLAGCSPGQGNEPFAGWKPKAAH